MNLFKCMKKGCNNDMEGVDGCPAGYCRKHCKAICLKISED